MSDTSYLIFPLVCAFFVLSLALAGKPNGADLINNNCHGDIIEDEAGWSFCLNKSQAEQEIVTSLRQEDQPLSIERLSHLSRYTEGEIEALSSGSTIFDCWTEGWVNTVCSEEPYRGENRS